ncbi:cytochrome-c oxidase [Alkalihalobacillus sp. R86527]|uniref:cytochrome-c oxidase n=1 Tax=Alkalihalobacillus sp. R86527 TaxID=3093863 RepID=UPI003670D1B8
MGITFIKLAVIYLFIGLSIGISMEMAHDHSLSGLHAHINLVGWVSMAIFGLIYHHFDISDNLFAKLHFWLYNLSLPVFMLGLGFLLYGNDSLILLVIIGSFVLYISVILFAINVLSNIKPTSKK